MGEAQDPAAMIYAILRRTSAGEPCTGTAPIFDGRRRFDLDFVERGVEPIAAWRAGAYEGDARLCEFTFRIVAGFMRNTSGGTDRQREPRMGRAWLAAVIPGQAARSGAHRGRQQQLGPDCRAPAPAGRDADLRAHGADVRDARRAGPVLNAAAAPPAGELFPPLEPYATGRLPVGDGHELHFEELGRRTASPSSSCTAGPAAGPRRASPVLRPRPVYRIVLFDQRGAAGPRRSPDRENTTAASRRRHRAAARASRHRRAGSCSAARGVRPWRSPTPSAPGALRALVLRGIFLCRPARSIGCSTGCAWCSPRPGALLRFIPAAERGDLLAAYHRRLIDPDPAVHLPAAVVWKTYELRIATLLPRDEPDKPANQRTLAMSRIECHYFVNSCFLDSAALLAGVAGSAGCRA